MPIIQKKSNISLLVSLFEDKKIRPYYDHIEFSDLSKHKNAINKLADEIAHSQSKYKRHKRFERDPVDDELHKRVDARNLSTAAIVSERVYGFKSFHITPNLNFKIHQLRNVRRSIYSISYYMLAVLKSMTGDDSDLVFDHANTIKKNVGFWANQLDELLNELNAYRRIPQYLLDDLSHVRRMFVSVFFSKSKMINTPLDSRRKLLMMERSDREIIDDIEEQKASFEDSARSILPNEAHMIDRDLLYDHDLHDNPRAKELIKKYAR